MWWDRVCKFLILTSWLWDARHYCQNADPLLGRQVYEQMHCRHAVLTPQALKLPRTSEHKRGRKGGSLLFINNMYEITSLSY